MTTLQVRKGDTWAGGIDKPALLSWGVIESALAEKGLRLVEHFERDEKPLPFDPSTLRPYDDDWDEVAIVRVERSQEIDLPDRIKWTKLTERTVHTAGAGDAAGEAAELAAEAASRRAAEARARQARGLVVLGVLAVVGVAALAFGARKGRR